MKKGVVVGFLFLILFTTFVSASFLSDFFNKKSPGLSPEDACSDTDGYLSLEESINVKGSVTGLDYYGNTQTYSDSCSSSSPNTVLEYYCDFNVPSPNVKRQAVTCPSESVCVDGACAYPTEPPSSGGGGNTSTSCSSSERSCTDKLDDDCDGIIDCGDKDCYGNSACTEDRTCADNDGTGSVLEDGEESLTIPGRAKGSSTKYDSCLSTSKISEAYCRSSSPTTGTALCSSSAPYCITLDASDWQDLGYNTPWGSIDVSACVQCTQNSDCGSGKTCNSNYKCIFSETNETEANSTITCEDSDGDNIYTKGTVKRCETTQYGGNCVAGVDACSTSVHVNERLCEGKDIITKNYECPSGYSCSDGACKAESQQDFCYLINQQILDKAKSLEENYIDYDVIYKEGDKIFRGNYAIIEDTIVRVTGIYNSSAPTPSDDEVKFEDVFNGYTYKAYITSEGKGQIILKGKTYLISYFGDVWTAEGERYIILDFPQSSGDTKIDFSGCSFPDDNSCRPLIDGISDVIEGNTQGDFEFGGINFDLSSSNKYENYQYVNNQRYDTTEYYAFWWGYDYGNENDGNDDSYYYYSQNVIVFDDTSADLNSWLEERLSGQVCQVINYNEFENSEGNEIVYVCSWDASYGRQDIDWRKDKSLEIIWVKDNVIVRAYTNIGTYLSTQDLELLYAQRFNKFLDDLQNNQGENNINWEYLGLDYPFNNLVAELLELCPSDIPQPTDDEGNECFPSWECKTEPIICPEYGYQTRTCRDYSCGKEVVNRIDCNPALCSGCYVPKWLGSTYSSKCIPYGFRFAQEIEGPLKLVEYSDSETLNQAITNDYKLEVISDTEAKLTFYDKDGAEYEYNLIEGQYTKLDLPFWDEEIQHFEIYTKNVVFYGVDDSNNFVDLTFKILGIERSIDTFNAYCDIDGEVKVQKVKDKYSGDWASCQNNYECDSNLCSGGQCVEINDAIREAGQFKSLFYRVFCRLANAFSEAEYDSCVGDFLGYETTPSEPGSSGGGGSAPAP